MRVSTLVLVVAAVFAIAVAASAGPVASPFGQENPLVFQSQPSSGPTLRTAAPPESLLSAILGGADYLKKMQSDVSEDNAGNGSGAGESPNDPEDGGWDWSVTTPPAPAFHTTGASPTNLYGVTALGLYYGYVLSGDAGYFTAMTDAADRAVAAGTGSIRSAGDLVFLMMYNDLPGVSGTAYKDAARSKYDGRITFYGSAQALAEFIRDARAGQGYQDGLIAWDIGPWARVAAMLGDRFGGSYASDADAIAEVLWQDSFNTNPGYFDVVGDAGWDSTYADTDYWYYTSGISGLITAFVVSNTHTAELPGLATRITASQYASGAVSGSYGANPGDEDWQSTAYAAMALGSYDAWTYASPTAMMGTYLHATRDVGVPNATGGWRYTSGSHYPEVCGENVSGLYFAYLAGDHVGAVPDGDCLTPAHTCENVPVMFTRTDLTGARGASVTFQLSPELMLCTTAAGSIHQGTWLSAYGNKVFQVVDNGGGSYTVDQSLLGTPCGITTGGQLFTIDVKKSGGDGTGTITVTNVIVRDCVNAPLPGIPGAPATITIDTVAPAAMTNLSAAQVKAGNMATRDTTGVTVTFTPPSGAAVTEVWAAPFGNYPEYDDAPGSGSIPTTPSYPPPSPWVLTSATTSGSVVYPGDRDFWYFVAFTKDACGNVSAVSNKTAGTLNYHLGDVSDGSTLGHGDNVVGGVDISLLGAHYGAVLGVSDLFGYLDVGPTTDYSVDARPTTDNKVNFEDLMMFAINHGAVSKALPRAPWPAILQDPSIAMTLNSTGDRVFAHLLLDDNSEFVKGAHAQLSFDRAELEVVSVSQGALLNQQDGLVFLGKVDEESGLAVDAARLGEREVIAGNGELAVVEFRRLSGMSLPVLRGATLRDVNNRPAARHPVDVVNTAAVSAPTIAVASPSRLELVGARPNPFGATTEIVFRLPSPTSVSLRIYDVTGRMVRVLQDGVIGAGEHVARWDGRAVDGSLVASGIYFYTFQANDLRETRRLIYTR